ncbi:hypothetical protein PITCH_A720096 [uncultured Desulfobacterium sp.]|uniref:Uncharacterized protein n=1 Tax=uncultured Desulfobacterium sp. TaxID=201089 RepID=A0A445N242_9BACT|nr:hypothetical protein PITCH_A720096 [uncultured Desulfobacterium sp.]
MSPIRVIFFMRQTLYQPNMSVKMKDDCGGIKKELRSRLLLFEFIIHPADFSLLPFVFLVKIKFVWSIMPAIPGILIVRLFPFMSKVIRHYN